MGRGEETRRDETSDEHSEGRWRGEEVQEEDVATKIRIGREREGRVAMVEESEKEGGRALGDRYCR